MLWYLHASLQLTASQNDNKYTILNINYLFVHLFVENHLQIIMLILQFYVNLIKITKNAMTVYNHSINKNHLYFISIQYTVLSLQLIRFLLAPFISFLDFSFILEKFCLVSLKCLNNEESAFKILSSGIKSYILTSSVCLP